jgi:hypothetical protein
MSNYVPVPYDERAYLKPVAKTAKPCNYELICRFVIGISPHGVFISKCGVTLIEFECKKL